MGKRGLESLTDVARELIKLADEKNISIGTAESCTGGMVATALTAVPGSSEVFKGAIVSYANEVKVALLDVQGETLLKEGAVSEKVALEMARGARKALYADYTVSITGVAGPGGGSARKPVGTVWIAVAKNKEERALLHRFTGTREQIRLASAEAALQKLLLFVQDMAK
ncbi:MAG: CinA family protein [Coriobacteriales bacterium]|jgi:nicotinamide-nucleotide amidase|nr:CinA family protein [Coriobacteriales bacterium]